MPIISCNIASSLDTDLLIMPTQMSLGTLVSDQSLTEGGVLRAGKLYRETEHKKSLRNKLVEIIAYPQFEGKEQIFVYNILRVLFKLILVL